MTAGTAFAVFVAVAASVVAAVFFASGVAVRRRTTATTGDEGNPLVAELTDEVVRWKAEARHWRETAERLQRELDDRAAPPGG
jgi:hypothetical protein